MRTSPFVPLEAFASCRTDSTTAISAESSMTLTGWRAIPCERAYRTLHPA